MMYDDFIDNEYKIFGLNGADADGKCLCGNPNCEAPYKHPVASNWQHSPHWSEEQVEVMEMSGQVDTGYGVLLDGQLLVVDIDERNGGHTEHMGDLLMGCGFIVKTGSGGESRHYYFKCPPDMALQHHLEDYKGVDFKSSGFVVGPGSMHASGNRYEVIFGSVEDIDVAPEALIELLRKPDRYRARYDGETVDISDGDISEMLKCIVNNDLDYEIFIRVGMGIHHVTGGIGFAFWDDWARSSDKYQKGMMEKRWHSFGKSSNPVTLGTLMHYAQEGGYIQSVEFECTDTFDYVEEREDGLPFSIDGVDLLRPSGFVGELTQWINSQCRYPREHLAVAAALVSIGNITGLRYTDDINNVTANLFAFCVAGSSSGKNDVLSAVKKIHAAAGIQSACHGAIKSEQEIIRNLIRHQASFYIYDELGEALQKIVNSKKAGGAAYLQGVIGMLMSVYSQADDYLLVTGDTKDEVTKILRMEHKQCKTAIENNEESQLNNDRLAQIETALKQIDQGIEKPFLSMIGFTTPTVFDKLVTFEMTTNGFFGRAVLVNERETNPRAKRRFKKTGMPLALEMHLSSLYSDGDYDVNKTRIEYYGKRHEIKYTKEAGLMMDKCLDWIEDHAEVHKERTGLEAVIRRGYELIAKVALILGAPEGLINEEHVRWAFALIHRDLEEKTRLAFANDNEKTDPLNALSARILSLIDKESGATIKQMKNRLRVNIDTIKKAIIRLEDLSMINSVSGEKQTVKYFKR